MARSYSTPMFILLVALTIMVAFAGYKKPVERKNKPAQRVENTTPTASGAQKTQEKPKTSEKKQEKPTTRPTTKPEKEKQEEPLEKPTAQKDEGSAPSSIPPAEPTPVEPSPAAQEKPQEDTGRLNLDPQDDFLDSLFNSDERTRSQNVRYRCSCYRVYHPGGSRVLLWTKIFSSKEACSIECKGF